MSLCIRNPIAEKLVRAVSLELGTSMTQAIIIALEHEMLRVKGKRREPDELSQLLAISRRCAALPDQDLRSPDEILGYDEQGCLPNGH